MKSSLFAAALVGAFAACAAAPKRAAADLKGPKPDWVDSSSMEYPREKYLTGVGMGDDRQTAEDRARAEISKVFSTVVTVNTNLTESETNASKNGANDNQFQQNISQNVQTVSKKALEGVEIVENWQDPATRSHYALAVLEREKAIAAVKEKIADFDGQAKEWQQKLAEATEKLPRVKAAMKVLALIDARNELNNELRVLDESGQGVPDPLDEAQVRPAAAKAVAELDVAVGMSGAKSSQIETGIVQGLNDFGLQAKTGSPDAADIIVEGEVDTKPMQGDGSAWKWARSTVTIALKDGKTAKTFGRFDVSSRQASADYDEAVRRSHVELAKKVSSQVKDAVTAYFENQ